MIVDNLRPFSRPAGLDLVNVCYSSDWCEADPGGSKLGFSNQNDVLFVRPQGLWLKENSEKFVLGKEIGAYLTLRATFRDICKKRAYAAKLAGEIGWR